MSLNIKFSELAEMEGEAAYARDFVISQLCIDTRKIQQGDTYLAIKGDRFDGHDFIDAAISSGASSLVVSSAVDADVPSIRVKNTVTSLGHIAKIHRNRLSAKVVGITGSNGKTTVKEMVSSICRECGSVTATTSNNNNTIGVPLTLLAASMRDEFVIVEMGTSETGEIAYLSNIVEPDVSVITNVSESHLAGIGSRQDVFAEKSAIISATRGDGTVVVNMDDDFSDDVCQMVRDASILTYGFSPDADIHGVYENTKIGVKVSAGSPAGGLDYELSVSGKHNVANSFAAIAIACALDVESGQVVRGLEKYTGIKGRLQTVSLGRDICLIDDTYNANPASSMAALDVLGDYPGRKIFVFAGMGELGKEESALHESVGKKASGLGVDAMFTFGEIVLPAVRVFAGEKYSFDSVDELTAALLLYVKPGDTVLVKGSRMFQMDRVSRRLEEELG